MPSLDRWPNWLVWTIFVVLSTVTQMAFKSGGLALEGVPYGWRWFIVSITTPSVLIAISGYIALFVVWMIILHRTELSRAFALTGLNFITVPAVGWLMFGERLGPTRIAGIVLIVAGVVLMGRSGKTES